ncbi:MAG: NB-ARC domain-containing protein [Chloroflexota bacterium]|nr:NB-ARC domain-containing protein [Chloroflexota bacterium]
MGDKQRPRHIEITGNGNVVGNGNVSQVVKAEEGSAVHSVVQVAGDYHKHHHYPEIESAPFLVPFLRNPAFVGRDVDLVALHELLQGATPVGIRPTGLSGMGGIGKTQLAVEYAYRHRDDYPSGIFWLNVLDNWADEFARVARDLGLATIEDALDTQVRAAWSYLNAHPDALVVLDNVLDPALLNAPFLPGLVPAALSCRLLFTTRQRDFKGQFAPYELKVLPEDAAMRLLLHHPARQAILDADHPEHGWARVICITMGCLPLALELAAAFLGQYPEIPLYEYRLRLLHEGAMDVVDDTELRLEDMPTRHEAAVQATLQTSWEVLTDEHARLVLRAAGQLREAELIPAVRLGLLTGLAAEAKPGHPAPVTRALKKLVAASLIEELTGETVRLHPLVREYAGQQTSAGDASDAFRGQLASNILAALGNVAALEAHTAQRGVDAVLGDLRAGLKLCPVEAPSYDPLQTLERVVDREAHCIRGWNQAVQPAHFAQRIHARAVRLGAVRIQHQAAERLGADHRPYLQLRWRSGAEDVALLRTLKGHTLGVNAVAVTPDGTQAVSAASDKTLRVWDLETGATLRILKGHADPVNAVAVTPDGAQAISASKDGTLKVWDLETGQEICTLEGHTDEVKAVAVTPDGAWVVSASKDETLKVWGLETGQEIRTLEGHTGMVGTVAVTPDGTRAISGSYDRTVKVWDLKSGQEICTLEGHNNMVTAIAVTPDGKRVVSGSSDRTLKVWDLETGQTLYTGEHNMPVSAVVVTPDGTRAISGFNDPTLRVWDLETGQEVRTFDGHAITVSALAVSPDGMRLVSASYDNTLKVWDLERQHPHDFEGHRWIVFSVAVTPDGTRAISASHDNTLKLWDLETGQQIHSLEGHAAQVRAVAVTPDSTRAVSASRDQTLKVWDLQTGREIHTLEGHTGSVDIVAVTPDGTRVVSGSSDTVVRVWDLGAGRGGAGRGIHTFEGHAGSVNALLVTSDGTCVVSGSSDNTLKVWDLETGQELRTLEGHTDSVDAVVLTAGETRVVSASKDKTTKVWDLETGQELRTLEGHTDAVRAVAVTPDGARVVSASVDNTLKVWNLEKGQKIYDLERHTSQVDAIALTSDGKRVVSVSRDQIVKVWDLRTGREITSFDGDGMYLCVAVAQRATGVWIVAGDVGGAVWALELVE